MWSCFSDPNHVTLCSPTSPPLPPMPPRWAVRSCLFVFASPGSVNKILACFFFLPRLPQPRPSCFLCPPSLRLSGAPPPAFTAIHQPQSLTCLSQRGIRSMWSSNNSPPCQNIYPTMPLISLPACFALPDPGTLVLLFAGISLVSSYGSKTRGKNRKKK